jgi:RNA polymerase sigma-70 factor, ECF subfamily
LDFEPAHIERIIDACLAGKETGYRDLFNEYFSFGKVICLRHASSAQEAEEILDDVFMKVFKSLPNYDRKKPFKAWFRTIIVHTCIDYYRSKNKLEFEYNDALASPTEHAETVLDKFGAEEILGIVQHSLSPAYRTVFLLHAVEGYSHPEIAVLLKINEITSRTNYFKARAKLQSLLTTTNYASR